MTLVNYVANRCATLGTRYLTISENITHLPLAIEATRSAYVEAGKEDEFTAREEEIAIYATGQHTLATYFREKPAAVFITGAFGNSSVWYGEGCARVGALSLGGTSRLVQNPFTVVCYDYPLIGEENIVAHAFISHDPTSVSTLVVNDYWKITAIVLMVIGTLAITAGSDIIEQLLTL
jgi:pimeloyl-ACP methyl ester carboxylesterase